MQISVFNRLLNYPVYKALWMTTLSTSNKKLGHITNINIWSNNLKFSGKTVLYFHFTALSYVQCAWKKIKITSFIEHAQRFRIHTIIINIPYYCALKFSKEKCFILPFLLCLYCIVLCVGCASNESLNHLHRARLRKNLEALQISTFSSLS